MVNGNAQPVSVPVLTSVTVPFRNVISDQAGAWLQSRHFKAPITGEVDFVLENFQIIRGAPSEGSYYNSSAFAVQIIREQPDGTTHVLASQSIDHNFSYEPASFTIPTIETTNTALDAGDIVYIRMTTYDTSFVITMMSSAFRWSAYKVHTGDFYIQPI